MSLRLSFTIIALAQLSLAAGAADRPFLHAPSVDTYARHDPGGAHDSCNGPLPEADRQARACRPFSVRSGHEPGWQDVIRGQRRPGADHCRLARNEAGGRRLGSANLSDPVRQESATHELGRRGFLSGWAHPLLERRRNRRRLLHRRGVAAEGRGGVVELGSRRTQVRRQLHRRCESRREREISLLRRCHQFPTRGD